MRTHEQCLPCFRRQARAAAGRVTDDADLLQRIAEQVESVLVSVDDRRSPPDIAADIYQAVAMVAGDLDPYAQARHEYNRLLLDMLPDLRRRVAAADDPFDAAVRLAVAGNAIDFGVGRTIEPRQIAEEILAAFEAPMDGDIPALRQTVERAESIFYVCDNAGEIVLDRLLMEQLADKRLTIAVRGGPIINDVTRADATDVGLDELGEVIDNGNRAPGTVLDRCDSTFRDRLAGVNLVISKGQGNFETLSDWTATPVFFLLKVKCPVVALELACPVDTLVVRQSADLRQA